MLLTGTSHYMSLGQSISDVFPVLVTSPQHCGKPNRPKDERNITQLKTLANSVIRWDRAGKVRDITSTLSCCDRIKCDIISRLIFAIWFWAKFRRTKQDKKDTVVQQVRRKARTYIKRLWLNTAHKAFHNAAILIIRNTVPDLIERKNGWQLRLTRPVIRDHETK